MCRNIHTLFNFDPPATEEEVREAALQYVREPAKSNRHSLILSGLKRLADPYRDLDVIDSRAPRFNQATIGALATLALVVAVPWLLGLLALQLAVGLTLGRRYCLPCLAYFELVQPLVGEGPLEDARPPRFANMVGAAVLPSAAPAYAFRLQTP